MDDLAQATRELLETFSRRDLEGVLALTHPDIELRSALVTGTTGGLFRGHEGIRGWFAALWEAWDVFDVQLTQSLSIGPLILVLARVKARGHRSGVDLLQTYGGVMRWEGGALTGWYTYLEPADAVEDMARRLRSG